jgi:hypothetical protein
MSDPSTRQEAQRISIDERDEGERFEQTLWAALKSVFPHTLYKSPQANMGYEISELTDVLACYEDDFFLIETKGLSVSQAGCERNEAQRIKDVQQQIKTVIKQLFWRVSGSISRCASVHDVHNNELRIARRYGGHCIVLITELWPSGDWSEIENELLDAIRSTGSYFHLIALSDFIGMLEGSHGQAPLLIASLMERFTVFGQTRSVHIRCKIRQ